MATATTDTRVKKVPDFRKLHSKWSKKMERVCMHNIIYFVHIYDDVCFL